jgi:hypothetical protein
VWGCLAETGLAPIGCDQPHAAEYAGAFVVARDVAVAPRLADIAPDRCRAVVAAYVGAPSPQLGQMYTGFDPVDWDLGVNTVRCYVTAPAGKRLVGRVEGIGTRAPRFG